MFNTCIQRSVLNWFYWSQDSLPAVRYYCQRQDSFQSVKYAHTFKPSQTFVKLFIGCDIHSIFPVYGYWGDSFALFIQRSTTSWFYQMSSMLCTLLTFYICPTQAFCWLRSNTIGITSRQNLEPFFCETNKQVRE